MPGGSTPPGSMVDPQRVGASCSVCAVRIIQQESRWSRRYRHCAASRSRNRLDIRLCGGVVRCGGQVGRGLRIPRPRVMTTASRLASAAVAGFAFDGLRRSVAALLRRRRDPRARCLANPAGACRRRFVIGTAMRLPATGPIGPARLWPLSTSMIDAGRSRRQQVVGTPTAAMPWRLCNPGDPPHRCLAPDAHRPTDAAAMQDRRRESDRRPSGHCRRPAFTASVRQAMRRGAAVQSPCSRISRLPKLSPR